MIHRVNEGQPIEKFGLQWSVNRQPFWFRVMWVWGDVSGDVVMYYFRFRSHLRPWFIFKVDRWNTIESWLSVKPYRLISFETYEDFIRPKERHNRGVCFAKIPKKVWHEGPYGRYYTWEMADSPRELTTVPDVDHGPQPGFPWWLEW